MPSRRRSCPGTRGPASSNSQRSNAPSLGSGGGPSPPVQQRVRRSWGGLSAQSARAASGEFGQGGYRAAVSSAAGYTPEGGSGRAESPASRGGEGRGEQRGEDGGTWPRPAEEGRAAPAPERAGPRGRGRRWDPRPPRPRSVPPPSPVPRRPAEPRFSRRTRTGQARDSGSPAGGRAARGGPGRAGACSPTGPPRAARPPAKPGPPLRPVYPGITCWRHPPGAPNPRRAPLAPGPRSSPLGPLSRAQGRMPASLSPTRVSPALTVRERADGPLTRSGSGNPGPTAAATTVAGAALPGSPGLSAAPLAAALEPGWTEARGTKIAARGCLRRLRPGPVWPGVRSQPPTQSRLSKLRPPPHLAANRLPPLCSLGTRALRHPCAAAPGGQIWVLPIEHELLEGPTPLQRVGK